MFFDAIAAGAKRVGRTLADLYLQVAGGVVAFSDDVESLIAPHKPGLAFIVGAMGSRQPHCYSAGRDEHPTGQSSRAHLARLLERVTEKDAEPAFDSLK